MGVIGGAIKLIIIPIVLVIAIAIIGGLYLKQRQSKAVKDVEQFELPPVSIGPPPLPTYAPSAVQYFGPAKPAPTATVQGYNYGP